MNKTLQTFRYLFKSFAAVTVIGFLCSIGSVLITDLVFYFTDRYDGVQTDRLTVTLPAPLEFNACLFALLIGMVLVTSNFKLSLANGISRRTFWLANLPAAVLAAAAFAVFNMLMVLTNAVLWPISFSSNLIYPQASWIALSFVQFGLYFLLIVVGWLITLAYYRSSTLMKWVISLAPFVLFELLKVANASSGGVIFEALGQFTRASMSTPYIAGFSMLVYSVIGCALFYLLIRRAPLKD